MSLTETRKADRAKMAKLLAARALAAGAVRAEIKPETGDRDDHIYRRCTRVAIEAARGLQVGVSFDGDTPQSRPDTHVLSWHMSLDSDARLADVFGYGAVNPYHHCKATQVAYGFEALCETVCAILAKAADGSAFSPEREAAAIAKDGTAAERRARFRAWADDEAAQRAAG